MTVLCILTCYNRKEKTEKCIRSLVNNNPSIIFKFIVVDDNSNDGTKEMLEKIKNEVSIYVIQGNGDLYYSGGMRLGMEYALKQSDKYDYLLMVNDDVEFFPNSIEKIILQSKEQGGAVLVGAMQNQDGKLTYGAVKYVRRYKYRIMNINEWHEEADTFCANCVLIPFAAFVEVGPIDSHYVHSLGDYDYGLELRHHGHVLYGSKEYCGICNLNSLDGTWEDKELGIRKRLELKGHFKGAPLKQWFYFLKKNFGIGNALVGSITPFIRILFKK